VNVGSVAGVIFFNDAGYLGMCGHGTMGVVRTLSELGKLDSGQVRLDTPAGTVAASMDADGRVTVANVPARLEAADVTVEVPRLGKVTGDVAYGGNWFFLTKVESPELELANTRELLAIAMAIRKALGAAGITGDSGEEVDHVELFGKPVSPAADSRNFVLCPGVAFDRSPCGTGTSAKLASLHARGKLAPGQRWVQEGIAGGSFTAWLQEIEGSLVPHVQGRAFVTSRATLHFDPADPFRYGWQS
jgi:proline racemase